MAVSDEPARLGMLREILGAPESNEIPLGVRAGDDAALIRLDDKISIAVASDFVRGTGFYLFELGHMNYFDVGYYLIAANISDMAAIGARPLALTTVVRYSPALSDEAFREIFKGMRAAADTYATPIVGGDIGGYSVDVLAATALGIVETDLALLRRNVRDGDVLCVTGAVGIPITALLYFKEIKGKGLRFSDADEQRLLSSWRRPVAHVRAGRLLLEQRLAHACQDVSDGLKATIEQLSAASGKTFTVFADRIPIDPLTTRLAVYAGADPVQVAMSASVDFQLAFTVDRGHVSACIEALSRVGEACSVIGEVNNLGSNVLVAADGSTRAVPGVAWTQQTGDYLSDITRPPTAK